MESRETVLGRVKRHGYALARVDEAWKNDREVVLTAVREDGRALQFAAEALTGDREIVLAAVQESGGATGYALKYATEALRADREVVLTAVQENGYALQYASEALKADREVVLAAVHDEAGALDYAADDLLEDPSFATEAKRQFHLLKVTMLSGRSTVVAAEGTWSVERVLGECRRRLGLPDDDARMELWHGSERVPADARVQEWPGFQPGGEISEYQLVVTR